MAQAVGLQFLLIAIGAISAAAIGMKNAAIGGLAKAHRHIQRPRIARSFFILSLTAQPTTRQLIGRERQER